jgi:transposase
MRRSKSSSGSRAMLLGLLVYGYATGVFSSRKLERATYDSVAFRFIARLTTRTTTTAGAARWH